MAKEFKNQWCGMGIMVGLTLVLCAALWFFSYEAGAGTVAFRIATGIVLAESLLFLYHYYKWYQTVNSEAAHMYNLAKMKKMSRERAHKTQVKLIGLSLAAGGVGTGLILIGILFSGISGIFAYPAVLCELVAGNVLFFFLTHSYFLPDRIIGKC